MPIVEKNAHLLLNQNLGPGDLASPRVPEHNKVVHANIGEGSIQSLPDLWQVIRKTLESNHALVRDRARTTSAPHP